MRTPRFLSLLLALVMALSLASVAVPANAAAFDRLRFGDTGWKVRGSRAGCTSSACTPR